jgi:hypothetical protein
MALFRASFALAVLALTLLGGAAAAPGDGSALLSRYENLKPALARSPFQRPLLLESNASSSEPHGDVYAVIAEPFASLMPALQRAEHWCDILLLQLNIKRCMLKGAGAQRTLQLALGRKTDQGAQDAQRLEFSYAVPAASAGYLKVQMTAASGPWGTGDYRLSLEAVPLGATHSFVHMAYSYVNGTTARMATSAYLATLGRNKVGFSVSGRDANGKPVYVGGVQGVAERNTMRYFLAIEAFLKTLPLPAPQRAEQRLREWFAATERHALQLHEIELDEYLRSKRSELRLQDKAAAAP